MQAHARAQVRFLLSSEVAFLLSARAASARGSARGDFWRWLDLPGAARCCAALAPRFAAMARDKPTTKRKADAAKPAATKKRKKASSSRSSASSSSSGSSSESSSSDTTSSDSSDSSDDEGGSGAVAATSVTAPSTAATSDPAASDPAAADSQSSDAAGAGEGQGDGLEAAPGDIRLSCRQCSAAFLFTKGEQEFFRSKGFDGQPMRCQRCRSLPTDGPPPAPAGRGGGGWGRGRGAGVCYDFQRGECTLGDRCRFLHEKGAAPPPSRGASPPTLCSSPKDLLVEVLGLTCRLLQAELELGLVEGGLGAG